MNATEALRMVLKNLKIIEAQDQGCGGNVTEAEAWRSAKRIAWHTINFCEEALETKDDAIALQYPQKDIDWQREQQIKAQGSTTPQRKPLTREDIDKLHEEDCFSGNIYEITAEIEATHGIKE